ncbi:hypothetical protein SADUNF_Sadunf15G0109300 [Salix dunnii]|uniref:Photolyase/cryptochrome alpha/beta domain-containing protein n=1 Tax=Salix dunnii TaxID=1413687 RepID=A0A835JDN0_9ROSI|nr:hypothetical protein SADUNF_Sadunf15G0109300 [Salix dunnii]
MVREGEDERDFGRAKKVRDLRLDDHPGLLQASKFRALLPLYVFDHRILSRYNDEKLELVLYALEDLRKSLKKLGSNLMIRFGNAENVIKELVLESPFDYLLIYRVGLLEQVKAADVFAEVEVEYHLREIMDVVEETLERMASFDRNPGIVLWQTPFYDIKNLKVLPASYDEFKKLQLTVTPPLLPPRLPSAEMELDWGLLPTLDNLKKFVNESPSKLNESWALLKEMSSETISQKQLSKSGEVSLNNSNFKHTKRKRLDKSVFVTQKQNVVGGGTNSVLIALAAYLRYLEGTARDDWQEVHEKLRTAEIRDGASFVALFVPALCLGIISRRRVYHESIKYEKERNAGFLSPFGYSTATVSASVDAVCSMEWYWLLLLKSQLRDGGAYPIRIWRWNGYLIQYTVVGNRGPAVLLVHGFGAFLDHFRDNISSISNDGNRVWAVTVLGFGKSEKPNVVYTELMWAELVRDFIIEVVREPVHLMGNSIGGYFVALVAYFWPALAQSVVLINSAGDIIPAYTSPQFTKVRATSGATWLGARLLLFYLRLSLGSIVKSCYPNKTERVDDWLINEMLRAVSLSLVKASLFVFISAESNLTLLGIEIDKKESGMKDPITDSKSKVAMLKKHCPGVVIRELDAGHCPHDEKPEEVNSLICQWILTIESRVLSQACS